MKQHTLRTPHPRIILPDPLTHDQARELIAPAAIEQASWPLCLASYMLRVRTASRSTVCRASCTALLHFGRPRSDAHYTSEGG